MPLNGANGLPQAARPTNTDGHRVLRAIGVRCADGSSCREQSNVYVTAESGAAAGLRRDRVRLIRAARRTACTSKMFLYLQSDDPPQLHVGGVRSSA